MPPAVSGVLRAARVSGQQEEPPGTVSEPCAGGWKPPTRLSPASGQVPSEYFLEVGA